MKDHSRINWTHQLQSHPLASIFPLLEGAAFDELTGDIRAHGVREPIWLYEDRILDGRNRYRAARAAGVDCPTKTYQGNNPLAFVLSLNLKRRHLNESQRAMAAAKVENMPSHRPAGKDANLHTSRDVAAAMFKVSPRLVASAAVVRNATSGLIAAVEQGHLAVSNAASAARLPASTQCEIAERARAGEVRAVLNVVKQKQREQRELELAGRQKALPEKRYGVIVADPPWRFDVWSPLNANRIAENHYPCMPTDEIAALDVPSIAAEDSGLFLWATAPMMEMAFKVMAAWGFAYKTHCVWAKDRTGTGYWFMNQHELLLVGTRGQIPAPAPGSQWSSLLAAPRGRHSEKPEAALEMIEHYFPNLLKIELYRRGPPRPGWDAWGNEAETLQ